MMIERIIIRNAHCKFFEGQTGLCKAKEFTRCNPVNCKSYTIDELSTILELQQQLKQAEQKLKKIKERLMRVSYLEPKNVRILKMDIENIIKGDKNE